MSGHPKADHTPGPWTVKGSRDGNTLLIYPGTICMGDHIAQVFRGSLIRLPGETVRANARLMASAPDLAWVCVELVRAITPASGRVASDVTRRELEPLLGPALAALAKAGIEAVSTFKGAYTP